MNSQARRLLILLVGALVAASGCGTPAPPARSKSTESAIPGYAAAYRAGHRAGKAVYDTSGKGAAIRETTWGGCTRRALNAGSVAELDRGAWVKGCLDGVADSPEQPPTGPVTKRTPEARLLKEYRTWAHAYDEAEQADHAIKLVTAQLNSSDYDIELATDYPAGSGSGASEALARSFVEWWDGDHGKVGVARNVLVLDVNGRRMTAQRIWARTSRVSASS